MGRYFTTGLRDALGTHKNVEDIRDDGLLGAVELVADRNDRVFFEPSAMIGAKVNAALFNSGVISRAMRSLRCWGKTFFCPGILRHQGRHKYLEHI